jgi:hypothetical protein
MNERGHYGTSRVGQALYYWAISDPKYRSESKEAEEKVWEKHPTRTGGILLAALGAIVVIGVVGAKRGVRFM